MELNILGLHIGHDACAAVVKEGRLVSMIEKERLTRVKYARGFSHEMVDIALNIAGITYRDIDYVAISMATGCLDTSHMRPADYWGVTFRKNGKRYTNGPRQLEDPWEYEDGIEVIIDGISKPGYQVQHHVAHIASSFYLSPFDTAMGVSYDGSGKPDEQSSYMMKCEGNKLKEGVCPFLNVALLYAHVCLNMYNSWRDSGKLMGLSAWGEPEYYYEMFHNKPQIDSLLKFLYDYFPSPPMYKMLPWDHKINKNVATSVQKWFEEDVKRVFKDIKGNIVTSGGGALNVISNRWIYDRNPLFITPFPKDSGLAVGGALYVLHHIFDYPRQDYTVKEIAFLGDGDESWEMTDSTACHFLASLDIVEIAKEIAKGSVVLWHQGRAEVGPRALTHRSIFADARTREMKIRVSEHIKGREPYRPLAPIVLAEDCEEWFDISPNVLTEMMLINAKVKSDKVPGITHVDGTARVQTITKEFNPFVHRLLQEYKKITGIPILINTSLNIHGQAISQTERDTQWIFDNCSAEICVINDRVFKKDIKVKDFKVVDKLKIAGRGYYTSDPY